MRRAFRTAAVLTAATSLSLASASGQQTTRESVDGSGIEANAASSVSGVSDGGQFVAFQSDATNLVAGDLNAKTDCFVRDRATGVVTLVSVRSNGAQGNLGSFAPVVSADGTLTAFYSDARNLVVGDTNLMTDIFVHDSVTAKTTRVSVDSAGVESDGISTLPVISADGMIVAFQSTATNLVAGDTNATSDVFVHDRATAMTTRVSVDSGGMEGNGGSYSARISSNGQFIFFYSDATNLVSGDTNAATDGFVYDRSTGMTERVTVRSNGNEGNGISYNGTISGDGAIVAFYSLASNLVAGDTNAAADVFIHERATGTTTRVSVDSTGAQGNGGSFTARISADARFVAFASDATNLVAGDTNAVTDVFRHDLTTGETIRLSVDTSGVQCNSACSGVWNSGDGRFTAFNSGATNLVSGDTNGVFDVFLRDSGTPASWTNYDAGWPGTLGAPTLTASAPPAFGTTITISLSDSTGVGTSALLMIGLSRASVPTGKDGTLLVSPIFFIPVSVPPTGLDLSGPLPSFDPNLCGFAVDLQAIELDGGASKGLSFTDGLELILGI